MAFETKIWKDRQSEYPNRRILTPTGTENEYEISRSEGLVVEEGDLLDAENLNDLEKRIAAAFEEKEAIDVTVTLLANAWTGTGPYTQAVSVPVMLRTDNPIADVILSDDSSVAIAQLEAWGCVSDITTADGSVIARCLEEKPAVDLAVSLLISR